MCGNRLSSAIELHLTALNVKRLDIDRAAVLTTWLFSVWVWMFVPPRII